ncbi:cytochrome P450 [Nocardia sp. CNY236]|uniref:cytochrome P450 family protein n=1 Tax=Nocardia sp. CNY236 TaxID=1169152 RepID=UPI0006884A32|nr:cytochrome P450 [Nocardia sp. CNY236]
MKQLPADFFQTPYAFYEQLRAEGPVHQIQLPTGVNAWLVVDFDVVKEVLRHPDVCKDPHTAAGARAHRTSVGNSGVTAVNERLRHHLLNTDPPQHSRLRKLVVPAFAPARMAALEPRVEAIADALLDTVDRKVSAGANVDLLEEFAFPLPVTVICELLGVPVEDRERFQKWSAEVVDLPMSTPESMRAATDAIVDYFEGMISWRRSQGLGDDLLSELLRISDDGDRLSHDELISMAFLILVAGHETTVNLIGNTALALLDDPSRWRALRDNPDGVAPLVEEMLRYNGPVNVATLRYTAAPIVVRNTMIPEGEVILVSVAAANHDERQFLAPSTFDPDRGAHGHLAFGHGIHYCLGAGLARLEARVALTRLIQRFPHMRLTVDTADLHWRESIVIRGLRDLPVAVAGLPS